MSKIEILCEKVGFDYRTCGGSDKSIRCADVWLCVKSTIKTDLYYRTRDCNCFEFPVYVNLKDGGFVKISNIADLDNVSRLPHVCVKPITEKFFSDDGYYNISSRLKSHVLKDKTIIDADFIFDKEGCCIGYWIEKIK